jgi:hypothetical protein
MYSLVTQIFLKKYILNMGISLHNEILSHIEEMDKHSFFKRKLKSFSFQHKFYSLEEYMSC